MQHIPVLLKEVLDCLQPQDGKNYVDATFGGGGYTRGILSVAANAQVTAFDRDPFVQQFKLDNVPLTHAPFSQLKDYIKDPIDGIVFDLGISSFQINDPERGFSFQKEGPLDMRMNREGLSAYELVNQYDEKELADIIYQYGEEHASRQIAAAIVRNRPIETTKQLADVIETVVRRKGKIHPATKTFQALRVFVNDELKEIEVGMQAAIDILKPGGRMIIVSFQGLENIVIKKLKSKIKLIDKIKPTYAETRTNPRSRSAILWYFQK